MSLNENYIISGSTLSDIGDALRAKNIIDATKPVTKNVLWCRCRIIKPYGSGTADSTFSNLSDKFYFLPNNITKAKIVFNGTTDFIERVKTTSGTTIYSSSNLPKAWSNASEISFPFAVQQRRGYDGGGGQSPTAYMYLIPLNSQGEFFTSNDVDTTGWVNNDNQYCYFDNYTFDGTNLIAVEDIATAISEKVFDSGNKFAAISPFSLANLEANSTDVSAYISDIDDVVDFYFPADPANGFWYRINPIQSEKSTLTSGAGNGKISYPVKQYNYSYYYTPPANWESSASNSGMRVFFSNGKLVVTGSYSFTNYYMPAFLVYK